MLVHIRNNLILFKQMIFPCECKIPWSPSRLSIILLLFALFLLFGSGCSAEPAVVAASEEGLTPQAELSSSPSTPTPILLTPLPPTSTEAAIEPTTQVVTAETPDATSSLEVIDDDSCQAGGLDEIRIGVLIPQSGSGAVQAGEAMSAAFDIAVDEINAAGGPLGKPMRLISADTAGDAEIGRLAAEKLIVEECVSGLVGIYHSRVGMEVKEVAHQYGVPILFVEPFNDSITAVGYPEVFRIAPTLSMAIRNDATWLASLDDYNDDGVQSATIIVANGAPGNIIRAEESVARFTQSGIRTDVFAVDLPTQDFSALIARIVALEQIPDVIFIRFNSDAGYALLQQLLDAGIGPQKNSLIIIRQSALNSTTFWEKIPDGVFTVIGRIGPWKSTVGEKGMTFADAYSKLFDHWPESYAFSAYDSLQIFADAIVRADTVTPNKLILALEETDIELASGHYCFPYGSKNPPDGVDVPDYMWHQWPDPALLHLQYTEQGQDAGDAVVLWPEIYRTVDGEIPSHVRDELQKIQSCVTPSYQQ